MLRNVLLKTLRDARRGFVWWSLGILGLVLLTVLLWPSIRDDEGLQQFTRDAPRILRAFSGGELDFGTAAGYLNSRLFALLAPLVFLVYAIGAGGRAVAGEEEAGTLDLVLANGVSRRRLVVEKVAALAVQLAVLAVVLLASLAVTMPLVDMDIPMGRVALAVTGVYLLGLAHGTLTLLLGAAGASRAAAVGVAAAVAVAGWLVDGLAEIVEALEPWRAVSPFSYVGDPLREGFEAQAGLLVALTLVCAVLAVPLFERRDVAV